VYLAVYLAALQHIPFSDICISRPAKE